MYYAQIRKFDVSNGPGIRSSLFVSGCTHRCEGCFNESYQHFNYGNEWTKEIEDQFINQLKDPNIQGVTILGGEPFDQIKTNDLLDLVKRIKEETKLKIWIYSGYTFEEILRHPLRRKILSYCDVLVDGKFVKELKDLTLKFRGSKNQRMINIKSSLNQNQIILLEDNDY